jgi:hypothetical protein
MLLTQQVVLELQRGLAHTDRNTGIGYFRDDPDLLELAAANLRAAQAALLSRRAAEPVQQALPIDSAGLERKGRQLSIREARRDVS